MPGVDWKPGRQRQFSSYLPAGYLNNEYLLVPVLPTQNQQKGSLAHRSGQGAPLGSTLSAQHSVQLDLPVCSQPRHERIHEIPEQIIVQELKELVLQVVTEITYITIVGEIFELLMSKIIYHDEYRFE